MKRLFDIVTEQVKSRPGSTMLASKVNGTWKTVSCKESMQQACQFAEMLLGLGVKNEVLDPEQQEKIAMISPNRPEWIIADLAVQMTGGILTPIYPTINPEEFAFIMNQAEVRILILSGQEMYDRFQEAFPNIPTLQHIITFDKMPNTKYWLDYQFSAELELKRKEVMARIQGDTVATIIYTSGTTGQPKGVMLTHNNILSNVLDSMPVFHFSETDDRALSFLPLNHIFEKMVSYIYLHAGIQIYYAESMDTIGDNLKEVKPMVFTCVPRLLEKVYEKIVGKGMELTGFKKKMFFWAIELGKKYDNVDRGSLWYRLQLAIANKLIFSKWREALGGRVKAVVSGSAPLSDKLIRIFTAGQITIMEGYGLTETSPVISVNLLESEGRRVGTVGLPIRNVEVKIADDGEILTRGPNNMLGYYKNPEKTEEVIDKDGWLYTGDIGELVEGRFLKITDRKKEMFKTSGGKYVAPQAVENKMRESPFIEQIMVVGPNRKFVSALIVPNFEQIRKRWADQNKSLPTDNKAVIQDPEVIEFIQEQVDKYNKHLSHIEQIKKFVLLAEEWTVDNGILTPKLSLKRKEVNAKYAKEIEGIYQSDTDKLY